MSLLVPLDNADCDSSCDRELGPAQIVMKPYCSKDGISEITIKCSDQRDALSLDLGQTYIDSKDQCSVRPKKLESSKRMMLDVSVGCLATDPKIWGLIFGATPEQDSSDDRSTILRIRDNVGRSPQYWEVLIQPIENGSVSQTWEICMLYAYIVSDQAQIQFSVDQPKNLKFKFEGFPHPKNGDIGFARWING